MDMSILSDLPLVVIIVMYFYHQSKLRHESVALILAYLNESKIKLTVSADDN
jgi:hypothetical protein